MPNKNATLEKDEVDVNQSFEAQLGMVGYRLRRAQLSVFQRFMSVFAELSLRPAEFSVMVLVDQNPGRKQTEIASALGVKRANFVALVDGLQARGLLERVHVKTDRRANALHLTPEGEKFLAHARKLHEELEQEFIDRLGGDAQRDQLLALLKRLT